VGAQCRSGGVGAHVVETAAAGRRNQGVEGASAYGVGGAAADVDKGNDVVGGEGGVPGVDVV
jgi:hypothetical protein